jgi:hypothetical protein
MALMADPSTWNEWSVSFATAFHDQIGLTEALHSSDAVGTWDITARLPYRSNRSHPLCRCSLITFKQIPVRDVQASLISLPHMAYDGDSEFDMTLEDECSFC